MKEMKPGLQSNPCWWKNPRTSYQHSWCQRQADGDGPLGLSPFWSIRSCFCNHCCSTHWCQCEQKCCQTPGRSEVDRLAAGLATSEIPKLLLSSELSSIDCPRSSCQHNRHVQKFSVLHPLIECGRTTSGTPCRRNWHLWEEQCDDRRYCRRESGHASHTKVRLLHRPNTFSML